jgi:hypothetical protein
MGCDCKPAVTDHSFLRLKRTELVRNLNYFHSSADLGSSAVAQWIASWTSDENLIHSLEYGETTQPW